MILLVELLVELLQHKLQITDNSGIDTDILIDLRRINIDLDDLGILGKFVRIACHAVGESCPQRNQQVTFAHAEVGCLRAVHTDHSGVARAASVKRAFSHQGIADRRVDELGKLRNLLAGSRDHSPAAEVDERLLRRPYVLCEFVQLRIRPCDLFRLRLRLYRRILTDCRRHILCDVDQNRARSSALCDLKCLAQRRRQILNILYDIAVLCDRHCHTGNVNLLKGVLSEHRKRYVRRNCHDRHGVHVGCRNSRHQICRAGAAGRHADTDLSRRPRIAVSRMCSSLLVGSQYMPDLTAVLVERVIDIQYRAAGIAEDGIYALLLQALHNNFGTV